MTSVAKTERGFLLPAQDLKFAFANDVGWPVVRSWNVNQVRDIWKKEPNRVQILKDRRLEDCEMVLMRKDTFENLLNITRDVEGGQAIIRHNLDLLVSQLDILEQSPTHVDGTLTQKVIRVLRGIVGNVQTQVHLVAKSKLQSMSPLSQEEKETSVENDEM